jgi:choice-of-anchor C domain-containing protein
MIRPPRRRPPWPWLAAAVSLALLIAVATAHANLITNGSFESGPAPGVSLPIAAGSTAITGWVVTRAGIDYDGTIMTAAQGACSVSLNGADAGGIAQTLTTIPHATYTVRFYMCGDPGTVPAIKNMRVAAAGQSGDFSADNTGMWAWDPGWNPHVWTFAAVGSSTTLEFYSLMSGDSGPAVDSVTVELMTVAGVDDGRAAEFALTSVAPNPTRTGSVIDYALPRATTARLSVFDLTGREVAVLADGPRGAGRYRATWDGRDASGRAAPGLYFVRLSIPGRQVSQRLVVLR